MQPFTHIHHIAITCHDIDKMLSFYQSLGFTLFNTYQDQETNILHLRLAETIIELFFFTSNAELPSLISWQERLKQPGIVHFALSTQDINQTREWCITELQLEPSPITNGRTGLKYFFIQDPEGNAIEVVESS